MFRDNWKVTEDGFWIARTMNGFRVGFSPRFFAKMGNIRYMELLTIGELEKGEPHLLVEALKAVHEISIPISGEIVEINTKVIDAPELLIEQPWVIQMTNVNEAEYQTLPDYKRFNWKVG